MGHELRMVSKLLLVEKNQKKNNIAWYLKVIWHLNVTFHKQISLEQPTLKQLHIVFPFMPMELRNCNRSEMAHKAKIFTFCP